MSKVKVVACSGIGKVYGLMAREAVLEATGRLAPETTETLCLAHIVTGDEEAVSRVAGCPCITVDGCPALCARKSVEKAGGVIEAGFRSVDEMRSHRGAEPGTATALTDEGWQIVDELAQKVVAKAAEIGED